MLDEVHALGRCEQVQCEGHQLHDLVEAAGPRGAQERLELREGLFDRIEVRTVRGQESETGPDPRNRGLDRRLFVQGEVVEDDHVPGPQRRDEDLLNIGEERGIVERAIEHGGCRETIDAQAGHDRVGLPVAARGRVMQARAAGAASVTAQQVGGHAGLVDEDVGPRIVQGLGVLPVPTGRDDVRPALLVGVYRFF